jgi:hypothetical protein
VSLGSRGSKRQNPDNLKLIVVGLFALIFILHRLHIHPTNCTVQYFLRRLSCRKSKEQDLHQHIEYMSLSFTTTTTTGTHPDSTMASPTISSRDRAHNASLATNGVHSCHHENPQSTSQEQAPQLDQRGRRTSKCDRVKQKNKKQRVQICFYAQNLKKSAGALRGGVSDHPFALVTHLARTPHDDHRVLGRTET